MALGFQLQWLNDEKPGLPLSLAVDDASEPPHAVAFDEKLHGTVTVTNLKATATTQYLDGDSTDTLFDVSKATSSHNFTNDNSEGNSTYVYKDNKTILSSGTTYYRCYEEEAN